MVFALRVVYDATKGKFGISSAIISGAAGGAGVAQLWQTYDCEDGDGFMPAVAPVSLRTQTQLFQDSRWFP